MYPTLTPICISAKVAYCGIERENYKLGNICDSEDPKTRIPYKELKDTTAKLQCNVDLHCIFLLYLANK